MHQPDGLPNRAYIHEIPEGVLLLGGHHRGMVTLSSSFSRTLFEIVLEVIGLILELAISGLDLTNLVLELTNLALELAGLALEIIDLFLEIANLDLQLLFLHCQ